MRKSHTIGRLLINGLDVGQVRVQGWENSWGFGQFHPGSGFGKYAELFGRWSILMHADDCGAAVCPETLEALREAEYAIDALHSQLMLADVRQCRRITQLNIDGPLIEWKEDGLEDPAPPDAQDDTFARSVPLVMRPGYNGSAPALATA